MNPAYLAVLLDFLLRLTTQAGVITALINKARSEGRDVTKEELDTLFNDDAKARTELEAAIAAADAREKAAAQAKTP